MQASKKSEAKAAQLGLRSARYHGAVSTEEAGGIERSHYGVQWKEDGSGLARVERHKGTKSGGKCDPSFSRLARTPCLSFCPRVRSISR
jgi:hypothetical protein